MPLIDLPLEQLKVYKPPLTRRRDFLHFWSENVKLSKEQPLNPKANKVGYPVTKLEAYSVTYDGFLDKTPISAWLLKPNVGDPLPALLFFHGYGGNKGSISDYLGWVLQGYVVMAVDVRGQSGESPDFARYPSGSVMGNMTKGILDKSKYYYRYVYMDCLRALEVLLGRSDVKQDKVGITGVSQGGGLALAVSGLDKRAALCLPEVPYLCHFERAVEVATQGPYLEILDFMKTHREDIGKVEETLSYFDAMNFAPEIRCPTLMSVGLIDTVCPASTVFAVFNHMVSERRELSIYPGMGHESLNVHHEKKIKWAAELLGQK
ncbi:MAG: acetylxylan esterase [Candidatus Brockarchaeota archaeon]|nr:acetylxylan esterase [Candidatus Brockarchaeota archaeon]